MGTTLLRYGLFGAILLSLAINSACFVCADEEQMELLRTMIDGVDEQLRGVEFKCTYTYSEYVVDTLEEAERFDTSKGRLVVHATGVLAKTKKMTYESFNIGTLETKHPMFYMSHVTVTNRELRAEYVKQVPDQTYRMLFVNERTEKNKDMPILSRTQASVICPLAPTGSRPSPNFLANILVMRDKYTEGFEVLIHQDEQSTNVSYHYEIPNSETGDTTYTISNVYPYPVLVDCTKKYSNPKREGYRRLRTSDHVRLNNHYVLPKKIYQFYQIIFDSFRPEDIGKWCVTKWESEDMGKEKPKKSDFYIYLDRDSDIGGLALNIEAKLNQNLPEYFDINKYSVRDLQWSTPLESQVNKIFDLSIWFRPLILLIAGVLIFLGCWSKWKSSRDSAS
ncbi:MAG: hypothetical protein ACOX6D_09055 [Thermoguttaceae bacterium]|jgi:hypothetical protein